MNAKERQIYFEGYKQGKKDELEKPMHFTDEQKAWVKNYIIINAKRQRADAIDECIRTLNEHASIPQLTSAISFLIGGLEQLKEQNNDTI